MRNASVSGPGTTDEHIAGVTGTGTSGPIRIGGDIGAGGLTANGQPRASRAAQFMPFAALTGFYELARQQEHAPEPRHELTDDEALELSRAMGQVKRGDVVRVTYYDWDCYRTIEGVVARIDSVYRRLQVVKTIIAFDDIRSLNRTPSDGRTLL